MLADGHGLFDQTVQIFWQVWCKTFGLEHSQNLAAGHETDLGYSVRISENDTWREEQQKKREDTN